MPETAAILAGGLATRLRGIVDDRPKCLVEVNGRAFLEYQLRHLRRHGFDRIVMLIGHQGEQVVDFLGDGSRLGVEVLYSRESEPLGTAGAMKRAEALLNEPFLLLNGDTMAEVDLRALYAFHCTQPAALVTMALCEMDDASDYGSVVVDAAGRVMGFQEKRPRRRPGLVNAGVYCFSPRVFSYIPAGKKASTETDLLPALIEKGEPICGFCFRGVFVDIGTGDRLAQAQAHSLFRL
jgi:NDP-sugar pyrophosphorylase family protein